MTTTSNTCVVPCNASKTFFFPGEKIRVGREYQATIPPLIPVPGKYIDEIMSQF